MRAMPRPWTVTPHDPIEKLEDNLWAVDASLPRGKIRRRMSIARLGDGRLVFHNGIPLEEPAMQEVEAFGTPAFLVVPNGYHRLDVHAWKQRYPGLAVLCPAESRARVAAAVEVAGDLSLLPADPALGVETLGGLRNGEVALAAASGERVSLIFGDAVMNNPNFGGPEGWLWRLLGSTGGPRVTGLARLVMVKDKQALRRDLERLAELPGLVRIVPSHGAILDRDPAGTLRAVAAGL
jgi:hypothetical protein